MTVKNDIVLWDNGREKLCLLTVPNEHQYKYIAGVSCITFGISYENMNFKGCDCRSFFCLAGGRRIPNETSCLISCFMLQSK